MITRNRLFALVWPIVFVLLGTSAVNGDSKKVSDLLRKARQLLSADRAEEARSVALEGFSLAEADKSIPRVTKARAAYLVGECYYQRLLKSPTKRNYSLVVFWLQKTLSYCDENTPFYPDYAKRRLREAEKFWAGKSREASAGEGPEVAEAAGYKVLGATVGTVEAMSPDIVLVFDDQRPDEHGWFRFEALIKRSKDLSPEDKRYLIYTSTSTLAKYLGVRFQQQVTKDHLGRPVRIIRLSKDGYPSITLQEGQKWQGVWSIIEYRIGQVGYPVMIAEKFGGKVRLDWVKKIVRVSKAARSDRPHRSDTASLMARQDNLPDRISEFVKIWKSGRWTQLERFLEPTIEFVYEGKSRVQETRSRAAQDWDIGGPFPDTGRKFRIASCEILRASRQGEYWWVDTRVVAEMLHPKDRPTSPRLSRSTVTLRWWFRNNAGGWKVSKQETLKQHTAVYK